MRVCIGGYIVITLLLQLQFKREIINILSFFSLRIARAQTPKESALFVVAAFRVAGVFYEASKGSEDPLFVSRTLTHLMKFFMGKRNCR